MSNGTVAAENPLSWPWWVPLIEGIAGIILGLMLFVWPGKTLTLLVIFLGAYWFVKGISTLVLMFFDHTMWGWKLVTGVLGILAGGLVMVRPIMGTVVTAAAVVLLLGFDGIIIGATDIFRAFKGGGWAEGALGVVSILLGLIILGNARLSMLVLPWVLGAVLFVGGIMGIFVAFQLRKA
jgi:uncharacterized membrane protein HdeD (DUF308 family)